ncbi:hypothetical protein [Nocardia sp. NPDC005825]|uniref:hypothetical protein n=1 Tax=unclassified Nocardia TaxID=2637762 RepID=UPI0033DB7DFA
MPQANSHRRHRRLDGARLLLAVVAVLLSVGTRAVAIAAPTTTPSSPSVPPQGGGTHDGPGPSLIVPATARRGTTISVSGENWVCTSDLTLTTSWSSSTTTKVTNYSFTARLAVSDQAPLGPQTVTATCTYVHTRTTAPGYAAPCCSDTITRSAPITIQVAHVDPPVSTGSTGGNHGGTTPQVEIPPPPTSSNADGPESTPSVPAAAVIGVVAVAGIALASVIVRRRRPAAPEQLFRQPPHRAPVRQPTVRVAVSPDMNPQTGIREIGRPARPLTVHVRMHLGTPEVFVRELSR